MRNQGARAVGWDAVSEDPQSGRESDPFTEELARRRKELFVSASLLTQDRAQADDLVQDTLERAMLSRHRFAAGTNLRAWLNAILRHLFIDWRRSARHTTPLEGEPAGATVEEDWGPLDVLTQDDVEVAMADLRPADAELVRRFHFEGWSYRDISRELSIPVNTAATRLHRARCRLRPKLVAMAERRLHPDADDGETARARS